MPEITMCCNFNCPLREKCYRYRAVPSEYRQSFALYRYLVKLNDKNMPEYECDYFWQIDILKDKILPLDVINNRYERDWKWDGIK